MKFLVIDESVRMRRIVVNALRKIGYTDVVEAEDGEQGLRRFSAEIGCVLTEWSMPVMSGIEFVEALRARADAISVPVIMVTTRSTRGEILEAVEAGVDSYIVKPFTAGVLKEKLEVLLCRDARN